MLLAFWDDGGWQDALIVAAIVFVAYLLVMWIGSVVWTYRDVQARSRDPFTHIICTGMVLLFNLPGILLYMVLRPKETLAEVYDRQLGAEALLHEIHDQVVCPTCRRKIEDDFVACPFCRTTLRVPCDACGKALQTVWVLCPYCGVDRGGAVATNVVPMRAPAPAPTPTVAPASAATPAASRTSAPAAATPANGSTRDITSVATSASDAQPAKRSPRRPSTATYTPSAPAPATLPVTDAPDGGAT